MKQTTNILLALVATTGISQAALTATNLSFEDDGVSNTPLTGWTQTSLGSDALDAGDFRTAVDPDNWNPDSTAGTHVLLLEGDNTNEFGTLGQALTTGTAEAGTYTFNIADAGVASFGGGTNATIQYGFSTDGTIAGFISGSNQTLTQGVELFDQNTGPFNGSVSYTADGTEGALHLLISTTGTDRHIATIGSTSLDFVAVPEPSSTALLGLGGLALILRRRK